LFFEIILQKFVQQGQDGYLSVKCWGMVPLVIRSILKLKQKLDELADSKENEE
jgi:hypothetical protein